MRRFGLQDALDRQRFRIRQDLRKVTVPKVKLPSLRIKLHGLLGEDEEKEEETGSASL